MNSQIEQALEQYWNAAYAEGQTGVTHDTADGAAQTALHKIQSVIASMETEIRQAKEVVQILNAGRPLGDIVGLHTAQNALQEVITQRQAIAELTEDRDQWKRKALSTTTWDVYNCPFTDTCHRID
jgi:hypothetical protein